MNGYYQFMKKSKSEIVVIYTMVKALFDNFQLFVTLLSLEEAIDVSPPVRKGSSIMKSNLNGNIAFKDSFLFLSCALSYQAYSVLTMFW